MTLSQRTKDALAVKAQGVRLGRPPLFPPEVVRRVAVERLAGWSLQRIADGLTAEVPTAQGGRRWYGSTVRKVLRSASAAEVA